MRSRRVSRARYTSPMPPAPSGVSISYGPSRVPALSCILLPVLRLPVAGCRLSAYAAEGRYGETTPKLDRKLASEGGPCSFYWHQPLQLLEPIGDDVDLRCAA